jgi:cytochrome c5
MTEATYRRARGRTAALLPLLIAAGMVNCAPPDEQKPHGVDLARLDSVLAELGGAPTADLTRGQRWRLISSTGVGLPPSNFEASDLPEPESHGAVLLEAYCDRCHGLPAPQMHSADEWPLLLRRMQTRAETLKERLGGPITESLMGEYVLAGMATAAVASQDELVVMTAYVQKHAMPVARPGEIGESEDDLFFVQRCSACHAVPSPGAHSASEWPEVVARMRANATLQDVHPLDDQEAGRVVGYLQARAKP